MSDHEVEFGTLNKDGSVTDVRRIKQSDIGNCPHFIFAADHYRENGICRCNDPGHSVMNDWGYKWDVTKKEWV